MSISKERRVLMISLGLAVAALALAIGVTAETHTWDDNADFADGDFDGTAWDTNATGVEMAGEDSMWKYYLNPRISEGTSGAFDDELVTEPCIVFGLGQYHIYYVGYDGTDYSIGLARSTDGKTYTKYSSNPVITKGTSGAYDGSSVRDPFVLYEEGIFKMWYTGINGLAESIAYATSTDGTSWTKYSSNPVLSQPSTGWGSNEFGDPHIVKVDGVYNMYLSGSSSVNNKLVGLATSSDGTSWTLYGSNPIIAKAGTGEFGRQEICDAAVVKDGPIFRMFFSGRNLATDKYLIGYAWSYDGLSWTRDTSVYMDVGSAFDTSQLQAPSTLMSGDAIMMVYHGDDGAGVHGLGIASYKGWLVKAKPSTNPVLGIGGTYDATHLMDPSVVQNSDLIYYLFYTCYGGSGTYPYSISRASSSSLTTWGSGTKFGSNPILSPGTSGAWDDDRVVEPSAMLDLNQFKIWYAGYDGSTKYQIGYASKISGTWTKYGSNPVLSYGTSGQWDSEGVRDPVVLRVGNTFHMWYVGVSAYSIYSIGHATSSDGLSWTKDPSNPVFGPEHTNSWEQYYVSNPSVIYENGNFVMYYTGGSTTTGSGFGVAYSSDGVTWTRGAQNPIMERGNSTEFDDSGLNLGCVFVEGGKKYVFFAGNTGTNWQIGIGWSESSKAWYTTPVLDASASWPVEWSALEWDATVPLGTGLKFQVATNNGGSTWSFIGPDGTSASFYGTSGMDIFQFQSGRYLRVRAFLETDDLEDFLPVIHSITVSYQERDGPSPPTVTVTSPNGGEDWMKTKTYPITWVAEGNLNTTSVALAYSTDNGTTWTDIATRRPNTGHYKWTVPSTETSGAMIRVTITDIDSVDGSDTSDATFAIDPPPPKAGEFFAPFEGEVLAPGIHGASWVVLDPWGLADRPLALELSIDGGNSWSLLADGLQFSDGVSWEVPDIASSSDYCRLRLSVLSWLGDISVIESGTFAIDVSAPTIILKPIAPSLALGVETTVTVVVDDDLGVRSVVLHVADADGTTQRTYEMTSVGDASWTVDLAPIKGDAKVWATASDGVNQVSSSETDLDIATASAGPSGSASLGLELAIAGIIALVVVAGLALVSIRRGR